MRDIQFSYMKFQRSGSTPASLYRVAAALCDERIIDLLSLCTFVCIYYFKIVLIQQIFNRLSFQVTPKILLY